MFVLSHSHSLPLVLLPLLLSSVVPRKLQPQPAITKTNSYLKMVECKTTKKLMHMWHSIIFCRTTSPILSGITKKKRRIVNFVSSKRATCKTKGEMQICTLDTFNSFQLNAKLSKQITRFKIWLNSIAFERWNRAQPSESDCFPYVWTIEIKSSNSERKKIENCNVHSSIIGIWVSENRSLFLALSHTHTHTLHTSRHSNTYINLQTSTLSLVVANSFYCWEFSYWEKPSIFCQ